jgi:hypothetical protein
MMMRAPPAPCNSLKVPIGSGDSEMNSEYNIHLSSKQHPNYK